MLGHADETVNRPVGHVCFGPGFAKPGTNQETTSSCVQHSRCSTTAAGKPFTSSNQLHTSNAIQILRGNTSSSLSESLVPCFRAASGIDNTSDTPRSHTIAAVGIHRISRPSWAKYQYPCRYMNGFVCRHLPNPRPVCSVSLTLTRSRERARHASPSIPPARCPHEKV